MQLTLKTSQLGVLTLTPHHSPCALWGERSTTACPSGRYRSMNSCLPCSAGRYGLGPLLRLAQCSGACTAGFMCAPGSSNDTAQPCPNGQYSLSGAGECTDCPPGRFGAMSTATSAACTGPCDAGRFGSSPGLVGSGCTGNCSAGYACPPGSTSPTAAMCEVGKYSLPGWGSCAECSAGLFGASPGLATAGCSGQCPAGRFGAAPALLTASCSGPCEAGRYGPQAGLTSQLCSGPCPVGYFCPAGTINGTTNVRLGSWRVRAPWCTPCALFRAGGHDGEQILQKKPPPGARAPQ
jgi:hypothetical protein